MITSPRLATRRLCPGLSLPELSVVLVVLQIFLGLGFFGVRAYKTGADRAQCVMNIRNVQNAVRSYSNVEGLRPGQRLGQEIKLWDELVGEAQFLEVLPDCPAGGLYGNLGNRIPAFGELYLSCTLGASDGHKPQNLLYW